MALTGSESPGKSQVDLLFERIAAALGRTVLRPHPSVTEVGEIRRTQLMMALALVLSVTNTAGMAGALSSPDDVTEGIVLGLLVVSCWLAYGLGRTRQYRLGAHLLVIGLCSSAYALAFVGSGDVASSIYTTVPLALVIGNILLSVSQQIILAVVNVIVTGSLSIWIASYPPIDAGRDAGLLLTLGIMLVIASAFRDSLARGRLERLWAANEELSAIRSTLEQRVAERTADLEQRSAYLTASAEISRAAASILDGEELIARVVELIRERFDLYYVGLFLVDDEQEWAVLRAGTGEIGRAMLARGHRLRVSLDSMIGWAVVNARARVAQQAEADAVRQITPELSATRSEVALPLRSRGVVLGALTVQSDRSDSFDADTVTVLQAMADQVAVALDNARLLAASRSALDAERSAYGELSRRAWSELLETQGEVGYRYERGAMRPAGGGWTSEMVEAGRTAAMTRAETQDGATLAVPLRVRGQVVGMMRLGKGQAGADWADEEVTMLQSVAEQLGLALESARLYQDTQRRAARERLVGEVTGRIRETLNLDTVLQTAVREMGLALDVEEVEVRLGVAPVRPDDSGGQEVRQ